MTRFRHNVHARAARGILAFGLPTVLALAAACSSSSGVSSALALDEACSLNSDCEKGLVCALGRCRDQCVSSADCNGGSCVTDGTGGVCQTAAGKNTPCEDPRDCPLPLACAADYRCRNLCQTNADCNVLGVTGRVCGVDAQGVKYCADPKEVNATTGEIIARPPSGAPDAAVMEPVPGTTSQGGAIAFPIGPSGGTLGLGAVTVTIPPGALDHTVTVSITPITPPVAGSIGEVYEIGPRGTTFQQPVSIVFAYALEELEGKAATDFSVSTVVDNAWQAVSPPFVDPYMDTIGGTTMHFSPYALAANGLDAGAIGSGTSSGGDGSAGLGSSGGSGDASTSETADGSALGLPHDGGTSSGGSIGAPCSSGCGSILLCCPFTQLCVAKGGACSPLLIDSGASDGATSATDAPAR